MIDRRLFLGAGIAVACASLGAARAATSNTANTQRLQALQDSLGRGARLGLFAVDTGSGRRVTFNANQRFAMCSVFKLPLDAFVLRLADRRLLSLSEQLSFTRRDLLENSPVVKASLNRGRLSIAELAEAAVGQSDNSAANLLLRRIGGPAALTRFIRSCGDPVTRVDRYELGLNSNADGDLRDTTTPAAMAALSRNLVLGNVLGDQSRLRLIDWLRRSVPKPDRLKASLPQEWQVGHKPGTGRNGAVNDVAIAWPPGRPPIVVAAFISEGEADAEARAATHRALAALIVEQLGR